MRDWDMMVLPPGVGVIIDLGSTLRFAEGIALRHGLSMAFIMQSPWNAR
jgi:hypothetical protein